MALTPTLNERWHDTKRVHVVATVVASGNYITGGEALATTIKNLAKLKDNPFYVEIHGISGYIYAYVPATGLVKVFYADNNNAADGPLIEIPAAAYPAGVTGDVIKLYAIGKV